MTPTTSDVDLPADLVEQALKLSPAARVKFARLLLDAAAGPPDDPVVVRKEWQEVITQRIQGYLDGSIPAVDAEDALAEVERRFREKYPR